MRSGINHGAQAITMLNHIDGKGRYTLEQIARRVMVERGFQPDFSTEAINQLAKIQEVHDGTGGATKDLRNLLWASIDNDDSLDLDQLTVAEALPDNAVRIRVAVADVDMLVKRDTAIDEHARQNTTSIYTAGKTFPMLPEKLSTDLTSLSFQRRPPGHRDRYGHRRRRRVTKPGYIPCHSP